MNNDIPLLEDLSDYVAEKAGVIFMSEDKCDLPTEHHCKDCAYEGRNCNDFMLHGCRRGRCGYWILYEITKDTHRIAVDGIMSGTFETYCGIRKSSSDIAFYDNFTAQDPTCTKCREAMIVDRFKGKGPRKDDPQWLREYLC